MKFAARMGVRSSVDSLLNDLITIVNRRFQISAYLVQARTLTSWDRASQQIYHTVHANEQPPPLGPEVFETFLDYFTENLINSRAVILDRLGADAHDELLPMASLVRRFPSIMIPMLMIETGLRLDGASRHQFVQTVLFDRNAEAVEKLCKDIQDGLCNARLWRDELKLSMVWTA